MRQKITKEPLSREQIKHTLLEQSKASFVVTMVCIPFLLLFLIPITVFFFSSPPALLIDRVLTGATIALIYVIPVCGITLDLRTRIKIQKGGFEIHAVPLSYKSEEPRYRRGRLVGYTECFHFSGFRRVDNVPHTIYQLADAGEIFYLVTLSDSPKVLLYSAEERYEFKELFEK